MGTSDRRAREKDAKRRAILSAAIRCFGEKGYDGTTLDEVGRRAEVAKGFKWVGITEHIPPASADFLFPWEVEEGHTFSRD